MLRDAMAYCRAMRLRLILLAMAMSCVAQARADELPAPVAQALGRAGIPAAAVGVWVQPVDAARPAVAVNASQPMNPASLMKLVTTFAALEILGPTYTWRTEAYLGGPLADGVLDGDLVLKGYGDPKLTMEGFWLFLQGLRARGVREIRGDLVLDRAWFEPVTADPGRFDGEPLRAYNVAPDALLVNFKAVRFLFSPEPPGRAVRVIAEPALANVEVSATVRAVEGACGDWRSGLKLEVRAVNGRTLVEFVGAMAASCGERYWNLALLDHREYLHGLFRSMWEAQGGILRGGVRDGSAPPGARPFAVAESPSAAEIVRDVNKFSNNVMARQVFLTLSAESLKLPGRADRSTRVIQSHLGARGIELPELVMENGSGLSRQERISAGGLGKVLIAAWRSPVMPEFVASLPLVAYDGTMRRRMRDQSAAGQGHIKTGSLAGVASIAGYVLDRAGRRVAVVFIVNHPNAAASQGAQDALLRWVHDGRS
jgi:D-alanyl-D-alanine carboxypeptidase/D-alanyl-D-alanine-endopeptidase (penicillin-binding protein 4)